ncbi:MAG TPA: acyl-CoA dehydrogenase family protein [Actinomycetota bacterium]|nr:acyl-CoA dehydrogenase family protein [Actinomycetota bacterium]
MDFDFSAEQYGLRDEARRFLERQCPVSHVREFLEDPSGWSRDLWKQMADLGWMALPFPEQYGGLGQSFLDLVLLLGELGRALAPVPFLSSVAWCGQIILAHGNDEQRARFLPQIASGDRIAALALSEQPQGFAPNSIELHATETGGGWRITGEKRYVLDAPAADLFLVAACVGDQNKWFVVEEGARVRPQTTYDPTRCAGDVSFEDAVAEPLEAPMLHPGLQFATAALCAEMIGTAERILDMTVEYSKQREQFGRPIGSFQAIKHKCAEMATELEAARAAAYYACWAVSSGAEDAPLSTHIAKSYCSDQLAHLAGEGVQAHGGIAFTWEHDMHLYLKRVKTAQVLLGDGAFHRERIARIVGL